MLNTMFDMDSALAWSSATWMGDADREGTYFGYSSRSIALAGLAPFYRVFVLQPMMARYRREMDRLHAATSLTYEQFKDRARISKPAFADEASISLVVSPRVIETTYRADAYNLVAYTALAMHRYRAEHGKFPNIPPGVDARATIPLVPGDPYSDQPLKLENTDQGWVVYSIGPDTTDNHGARRLMRIGMVISMATLPSSTSSPRRNERPGGYFFRRSSASRRAIPR